MIYNTISGDTWDAISYRVYGSEFYVNELINANLQHIDTFIFSANITLNIPDIDTAINEQLPPWERPNIVENTADSELLDLYNGFDSDIAYILSYRFLTRFNKAVTNSSNLEG